MHRVVVTGMGCISSLGAGVPATWQALKSGRSGIDYITLFDASKHGAKIAGEVKNFDPCDYLDRKVARRMDRFVQFAHAAAFEAVDSSRLPITNSNSDSVGVFIGSGVGGIETMEREHRALIMGGPRRVSPFFIPMMISNMASGQLSISLSAKGPSFSVVTACASGNHAIGLAWDAVRRGEATAVVAGGAEAAITPLAVAGFANMKALSTSDGPPQEACKPLYVNRDGFVIGEGAGALVLETLEAAEKRGADILAEVVGFGMSADAHHLTRPSPDGDGAQRAMVAALESADMSPDEIGYINCHAPGTPAGDETEAGAIKAVFGDRPDELLIGSTKSMHGHSLGATGAVELIATIEALREGIVPATLNLHEPDPACDGLNCVMGQAVERPIQAALSNSFGFGGQNATVIVRKPR